MSKTIQVGSTVIEFPTSGTPANWAPAIVEFADAVSGAINQFAGPFDVPPQVINIDSANPGLPNTNVEALNFPVTSVRSVFIRYAVYRQTNTSSSYETGTIMAVYSPNNPIGNKWDFTQDFAGDGKVSFNITDTGQVQYTATALAGTGHTGRLTIVAQAVLQA
jgi:hypothetical protein